MLTFILSLVMWPGSGQWEFTGNPLVGPAVWFLNKKASTDMHLCLLHLAFVSLSFLLGLMSDVWVEGKTDILGPRRKTHTLTVEQERARSGTCGLWHVKVESLLLLNLLSCSSVCGLFRARHEVGTVTLEWVSARRGREAVAAPQERGIGASSPADSIPLKGWKF